MTFEKNTKVISLANHTRGKQRHESIRIPRDYPRKLACLVLVLRNRVTPAYPEKGNDQRIGYMKLLVL